MSEPKPKTIDDVIAKIDAIIAKVDLILELNRASIDDLHKTLNTQDQNLNLDDYR